jgi:glutaredoxin-like protein NrdH
MDISVPVLFTQEGCAESGRVRAWLTDRQIPFIERNVTDDVAAARDLARTGIFATPLLVIGDRRVLGYRPDALQDAVDERSPP